MAISIHSPQSLWDRTLPKPSFLLPDVFHEAIPRRTSSLLQHHVVGDSLPNADAAYSDDYGRRSTVPYIPATRDLKQVAFRAPIDDANIVYPESQESLTKKRTSSVMSADDASIASSPASPTEGSNQFCLCQPEPKIPRPRNAFILYRQHYHATVVAQNPGLPNPDISKIIGEQWRQLPEKAREEWKALAEEEKARHSQQYPDYRYKPRRNGRAGGQSSVSGPSSSDIPTACNKCGGKTMNPPHTPYTPITPGAPVMPQTQTRMPANQAVVSPPHSARMRQYAEMMNRPVPATYDPRYQYPASQHRPSQITEGPESKKRRFNGDPVYSSSQQAFNEQTHQQPHHERSMSNAVSVGPYHRPTAGGQQRNMFPNQSLPSRSIQPQHKREPSLTLAPIKMPMSQQTSLSINANPQSQKSGVEAMIMSIPVLNKIKILAQISPSLSTPGPASPPLDTRGAIIAVEGLDSNSVYNMTHSLAEQLEKEGKFAVRIFGGPDPYALLDSGNRAGGGLSEQLNASDFLNIIGEWHKISKDMQDYITTAPRKLDDAPEDDVMRDADHMSYTRSAIDHETSQYDTSARSPISAVSPKTISQTADLSLKSPRAGTAVRSRNLEPGSPILAGAQAKSRIPASAMAQVEAHLKHTSPPPSTSSNTNAAADEAKSPTTAASATRYAQPNQALVSSTAEHINTTNAATSTSPTPIPIAIVPHYQLTTVDASSIAMPINDAYSPHSHWQWLATLWRGCTGPDVTVIIQSQSGDAISSTADEMDTTTTNNAAAMHRQPQPQAQAQFQPQQDVEVRLLDCRAVVVRSNNTTTTTNSTHGTEWWDKAKRRVGFEVEEFLRR